jgi:hypothetical protein
MVLTFAGLRHFEGKLEFDINKNNKPQQQQQQQQQQQTTTKHQPRTNKPNQPTNKPTNQPTKPTNKQLLQSSYYIITLAFKKCINNLSPPQPISRYPTICKRSSLHEFVPTPNSQFPIHRNSS